MNCTDLEIDKIPQASLKIQVGNKDSYPKIKNLHSPRVSFNKKEKRNRKFFLKRSVFFVSICKQTGNIELNLGSDFLHIEIMQGGHLPLNQHSIQDIRSETFNNDDDFKEQNVEGSLKLASAHLRKKIQEMNRNKDFQDPSLHKVQHTQRLNENLNGNFTNIFDSSRWNQRVLADQISAIEQAKKILTAQYKDFKKILYQK